MAIFGIQFLPRGYEVQTGITAEALLLHLSEKKLGSSIMYEPQKLCTIRNFVDINQHSSSRRKSS